MRCRCGRNGWPRQGLAASPALWPAGAARPLMAEMAVTAGHQTLLARPARFPCFTPCPQGAHPPLMIEKAGFDLFGVDLAAGPDRRPEPGAG